MRICFRITIWLKRSVPYYRRSSSARPFNRRVYESITDKMQNGLQVGLTEISDSFTMEEISAIARILAKNNAVAMGQHDAEEYINVIIEEKTKLNANDAKHAQTQEIQDYLARLKEQKK